MKQINIDPYVDNKRYVIGFQTDTEETELIFNGMSGENNKLKLQLTNDTHQSIPIPQNKWLVTSTYTNEARSYEAQLVTKDGTRIANTCIFTLVVRPSVGGKETSKEVVPPAFKDAYDNMVDTTTEIEKKLQNGEFNGKDGKSAYQIAVDNGFKGTEKEWIDSLQNKDYNKAINKPRINNVQLQGNKTLDELGIQPKGNYLTQHQDLTGYAKKTDILTKTSQLTNDSKFQNDTEVKAIVDEAIKKVPSVDTSNFATKEELKSKLDTLTINLASIGMQGINLDGVDDVDKYVDSTINQSIYDKLLTWKGNVVLVDSLGNRMTYQNADLNGENIFTNQYSNMVENFKVADNQFNYYRQTILANDYVIGMAKAHKVEGTESKNKIEIHKETEFLYIPDSFANSKLDKNQGAGNKGKILKVNQNGEIEAQNMQRSLEIYDYIADCNQVEKIGIYKTNPQTLNLPDGLDEYGKWGILLTLYENEAFKTGTQLYFPADGQHKERSYSRNGSKSINGFTTWRRIMLGDEMRDYALKSSVDLKLNKNLGRENAGKTLIVGEDGNITFR